MKTLFEVADVIRGDGKWMRGYEADPGVVGRTYNVNGRVCDPTTTPNPSGAHGLADYDPFVVETKQKFSTLCEPDAADKSTTDDLDAATEYLVGKQFWTGAAEDWDGSAFLDHADVSTVAAGADTVASIAAALQKAYDDAPSLFGEAVVHLGVTASLSLPSGFAEDHPNVTFVENAGYPTSGIAVTGAVKVYLGDVQTIGLVDQATNDVLSYASRFATVEFDPRLAVRVA